MFLISIAQISIECETQESYARYNKHLNLRWPGTYMCRYRVKQNLIVLKLDSISMNKVLVTEFVTVKVLKNLNLIKIFQQSKINYFVDNYFQK